MQMETWSLKIEESEKENGGGKVLRQLLGPLYIIATNFFFFFLTWLGLWSVPSHKWKYREKKQKKNCDWGCF